MTMTLFRKKKLLDCRQPKGWPSTFKRLSILAGHKSKTCGLEGNTKNSHQRVVHFYAFSECTSCAFCPSPAMFFCCKAFSDCLSGDLADLNVLEPVTEEKTKAALITKLAASLFF
jgi:hypothetical protein